MSRSYRKTTIFGYTTARSEKEDKKIWHGIYRARSKSNIEKAIKLDLLDDIVNPLEEEVFNVYSLSKDGKHYWSRKSMNEKIEQGIVDKDYIRKIMCK